METNFTADQITFIQTLIVEYVDHVFSTKPSAAARQKHYHDVPELRVLIRTHLAELAKELGDGEFDLSVFRFVLKKYANLRVGDLEFLEGAGMTRFDNQVGNAIRNDGWIGFCPIENTGKVGKYRIVESPAYQNLFSQAQ